MARYLAGRKRVAWCYPWQEEQTHGTVVTDSDCGGDRKDWKSTSGGGWLIWESLYPDDLKTVRFIPHPTLRMGRGYPPRFKRENFKVPGKGYVYTKFVFILSLMNKCCWQAFYSVKTCVSINIMEFSCYLKVSETERRFRFICLDMLLPNKF